jgi:phytanoyl-CoA hydroxylase
MLNQQQARQFKNDGYLVLAKVFSNAELEKLKSAALRIVDEFDIESHHSVFSTRDRDAGRDDYFYQSAERIHCFLEEDALDEHGFLRKPARLAINKIGHALHDLDPAFKTFCQQSLFAEMLRDLGYSSPLLWQTMYIFKQPGIGGEVRWHQDASYLITTPPSVTGLWIAIEDADRDNGCLWVQPGGHRSPLREIFEVEQDSGQARLKTLDATPWPSTGEALAVEVDAGSIVLFDGHMPHFSSKNASPRSRHAFTMHVAEENSHWSTQNWLQRPSLGHFEL